MTRSLSRIVPAALGAYLLAPFASPAQTTAPAAKTRAASPEQAILQALANNTTTAPYQFQTARKDGRTVLSGRVGTKEAHDVAVRLAIAVTPSLDNRLVIDTNEAHRVAALAPRGPVVPTGPAPFVYPPPLFGRLDDPFYGFEPPLISYPPWWAAVKARQPDPYGAPVLDPDSPIGPDPGAPRGGPARPLPPPAIGSGERAVELTIDPIGVAVLRGTVPSAEASEGIAQKALTVPGVKRVVNRLEVRPDPEEEQVPIRDRNVPPPPPMPGPAAALPQPAPAEPNPPAPPAAIVPADTVEGRVAQSIERRPALKGTTVKAEVREGIATLTGRVPTAYEAMLAYRSAQQTVGVRSVVDRLEFAVPDGQGENPLITKGRPDDVEPYLEAQLRRQLDDQAQVDRVRVAGNRLELKGTIRRESDRPRVEAVLRSMPLLRGFTLDLTLTPE